ncbi:MAG: cysteine desulfurase NifS [Desulfobacterales bacterium]|nr:cysteine desulfurase NifS [Desulfobacterales bacterium]
MSEIIYVDNNATTKVDPEVLNEMVPYFDKYYGNPSSMHSFGGEIGKKIQEARLRIASLISAHPEEILFTSCGSESNNTAIRSAILSNPLKKHIVTSRVEHASVKNLCDVLSHQGYRISYIPVDSQGNVDLDFLAACLTEDTAIVSLMWANNETGVIFPIESIANMVKSKGILFHVDAVQALGKLSINMAKLNVDMLSVSGHKIHAPKGIGALFLKKGTKFSPFLIGGHQEHGRRGGTENVASIIGFGKAAELASKSLISDHERIKTMRDTLETELIHQIPNTIINGEKSTRLPNTTSISFEYVEGEAILLMLNEFGICASSGSACTSGSLEPSHVLRAMGVPFTAAHGTIRFSLSKYNTSSEMHRIIEILPNIIQKLRNISPFWKA